MIFFDYQFHLMILMQPSVGYLFKKKKNLFKKLFVPPSGQHPITRPLHSIPCVKCLINPLIILGGMPRQTLDA